MTPSARPDSTDRSASAGTPIRCPACHPAGGGLGARGHNGGVEISEAHFEDVVADALDSLPPSLGELMNNVAVIVEDWPTPQQLGGRAGTLLGLYEGVALTRRSPMSYSGVMPDRITLFRQPIAHLAGSEEDLVRVVRRTVIHEVAHHFGISDARLQELGWG